MNVDHDKVIEAWREMCDVIRKFAQQIIHAVFEMVRVLGVALRRGYLVAHLKRWKLPNGAALWLAQWWPERWLPPLPSP